MKSSVSSPLFIWVLILITVTVGIIILSDIDPVRVHITQRRQDLPKKLQKVKKEKARTDVVFFGDSLMQAAIPPTEYEINKTLSVLISRPVRVVNLAMDGRSPWDLDRRSDQILALNPKIIVIQSEMIVGRRIRERENKPGYFEVKKERLKNWISYAKSPLMQPLSSGSPKKSKELLEALSSPAQVDIKVLKEKNVQDEATLKQIHLRRVREHWGGQIISIKSPEYKSTSNFIEKAVTNGTRVIVVEMPVSETAGKLATEEYLGKRRQVILSLLNEDPGAYLRYPKPLPDRFFDDYSHANVRGQKAYFKWLAAGLAEKLLEKK